MFASGFRLWLKRRLPKLSNVDVKITNRSTRTSFEWAGLNSLLVSQIELTFGSNKRALLQIRPFLTLTYLPGF